MTIPRAYTVLIVAVIGLALTGCPGENRAFQDLAGPEWSYDQPFYVRPAKGTDGLTRFDKPTETVYLGQKSLPIPRPEVSDPRTTPRTAIWITHDMGVSWEKVGYFGRQQSCYHLPVDSDGTYGVRFIGPGIAPPQCKPAKPHMSFVVDTQAPEVSVFVSPNKDVYHPGEMITIDWVANDMNLEDDSARINVCFNSDLVNFDFKPVGLTHPCTGQFDLMIPDAAIDKDIVVRVTAEDRAGNSGSGFSAPIPVVYEPPTTQPTSQPAEAPTSRRAQVIQTPHGPQVLTKPLDTYPGLED